MFKDVQQLMVAELTTQWTALQAKQTEIESDVRNLQNQLHQMEAQQSRIGSLSKKKFSVIERLVTQRKAYREHQAKLAELKKLPQKIAALTSEIEIAKMQAKDKIDASGILQEIAATEKLMSDVSMSTTLAQLGITPADAVTMLEQNGITPLLDESDREIFERPRDYQSRADLIAVHKMDNMPTHNRLSTPAELGLEHTESITLDGKEYAYSFQLQRNTMHVSMNDEVSSHFAGNWDNCHYTVLQPFHEIGDVEIGNAAPNDTYTRGGIALSKNAWILCPADQVAEVKQQNPGVHVLGYQGENSKGLAAPFLSQLGYRAEKVGQWGWDDRESQQQFDNLMQNENINAIQHFASTDAQDEQFLINTNQVIAIFKMLRDNHLVNSVEDFERLKPQIEKQTMLNHLLGSVLVPDSINMYQKEINQNAIVANGHQATVFINKMERAGMPLLDADAKNLQADYESIRDETYFNSDTEKKMLPKDLVANIMVKCLINSRTVENERTAETERQM